MDIVNKLFAAVFLLGVGFYAGQSQVEPVEVVKVEPVAIKPEPVEAVARPMIPLETHRVISVEEACLLLNKDRLEACAADYRKPLSTASVE